MKILPIVSPAELIRAMEVARAAMDVPLPKYMTTPTIGALAVIDTPDARQTVGIVKEFGDRAHAISMRLSILARNAEHLGGHWREAESAVSEPALKAIAAIPVINETDPGPEAILAFIKGMKGVNHGK